MTSTQTHKVIMGIRSEHRGILCHEQNTSGNTFSPLFSSFFVKLVLCYVNINIVKKKLVLWPVSERNFGKLRINLCFHSIGEVGKNFKQFTKPSKNIWTEMIVFSRHQNHN